MRVQKSKLKTTSIVVCIHCICFRDLKAFLLFFSIWFVMFFVVLLLVRKIVGTCVFSFLCAQQVICWISLLRESNQFRFWYHCDTIVYKQRSRNKFFLSIQRLFLVRVFSFSRWVCARARFNSHTAHTNIYVYHGSYNYVFYNNNNRRQTNNMCNSLHIHLFT